MEGSGRGLIKAPGICLEELRRTMEALSQDNRRPGWKSNRAPLENMSTASPFPQPISQCCLEKYSLFTVTILRNMRIHSAVKSHWSSFNLRISTLISYLRENTLLLYYKDDSIHAVYSENHTKDINILCGQNSKLLKVKSGGIQSYHFVSKVTTRFHILCTRLSNRDQRPYQLLNSISSPPTSRGVKAAGPYPLQISLGRNATSLSRNFCFGTLTTKLQSSSHASALRPCSGCQGPALALPLARWLPNPATELIETQRHKETKNLETSKGVEQPKARFFF
jgi:hypothetical protein